MASISLLELSFIVPTITIAIAAGYDLTYRLEHQALLLKEDRWPLQQQTTFSDCREVRNFSICLCHSDVQTAILRECPNVD